MKKLIPIFTPTLVTLLLVLFPEGLRGEEGSYVVKKGDTLSEIARKKFERTKIYGPSGSLERVLEYNEDIQDSNLIFPKQKILLRPMLSPVENDVVLPVEPAPTVVLDETPSVHGTSYDLKVGAGAGLKLFYIRQTGDFGYSKVVELFTDYVFTNMTYSYGEWSLTGLFSNYTFDHDKSSTNSYRSMREAQIALGYRWAFLGTGFQDSPVFYNSPNGEVFMSRQRLQYFDLGGVEEFKFSADDLYLPLRTLGRFRLPMGSSIDGGASSISSVSGFGLDLSLDTGRVLKRAQSHRIDFKVASGVNLTKTKADLEWDGTKGKSKVTKAELSLVFGLEVGF